MTKLSWPYLSTIFKPNSIAIKILLHDFPKQEGRCLAELYVDQYANPVTEPGKILDQQIYLSPRQQIAIRIFLNSVAFSAKKDVYILSSNQILNIFCLANDLDIEIKNKGMVTFNREPALLKAFLSDQILQFHIINQSGKILDIQSIIGTDRAFILDQNLSFYALEPFLVPLELEKILLVKLPLADMEYQDNKFNNEFNSIFSEIARVGIDINCLQTVAKEPKSQIMLRMMLNKNNNIRLHLINELSIEDKIGEVEICSKRRCEPVFWFTDNTCVMRQNEKEQLAREYLLEFGATSSNEHNGFQMTGAIALNFLSHIVNPNNLPNWLKIDKNCAPQIISLPLKPILIVQESKGDFVNVSLTIGDFKFSLEKLLDMMNDNLNTNSNISILEDDTILTFDPQTIQSIKTIAEFLEIKEFGQAKERKFSEIALLANMSPLNIELSAEEVLFKKFTNFIPGITKEDYFLPTTLKTQLRPYQHDSLIWMLQLHRAKIGRLLADEMGLGKTLIILTLIAIVKERENKKLNLVIAPTSVLDVWIDEVEKHFNNLKIVKLHGPERNLKSKEIQDADILITSYAILRRDIEKLSDVKFRYLIIDEAQIVKNSKTESWKCVNLIQSEQKIALSGTPIENCVSDLYSILELVSPGVLGKERKFVERYSKPEHALELKRRIKPLIMRRKKEDVASDLPKKIENILYCDFLPQQKTLYLSILHAAHREFEKTSNMNTMSLLAMITKLRQVCCDPRLLPKINSNAPSAKLELFLKKIEEFLSCNRKIIVYSQFVKMQSILIKALSEKQINDVLWLHGSTINRSDVISKFQQKNGPRIIIVSLKAGGTGITLTEADTVIQYDPWWNPAVMDQAVDRAHRIGQTKTVHIVKFICKNSIEKQILNLCEKKRFTADNVLLTDKFGKRSLTLEEIKQLLEFETE